MLAMPVPYRLKRFVESSYYLHSAVQYGRSRLSPVYRRDPLIVYQMGKVGSEALEASLLRSELRRPLFRVHAMVPENITEGLAEANTTPREYYRRSRTDFYGYHLGRELRRDLYKHRWQVITMVRDPVAQNISSFFQILDLLVPDYLRKLETGALSMADLRDLFLEHYPPDNIFIRWFDDELGRVLDLDVYAYPFATALGHDRIRLDHVDLLIIRLEDFDRVAAAAVRSFLGLQQFQLVRRNEAEQKAYKALYDRFRNEIELPASYVDGVYESRYARHFYSDAERRAFRGRLNVAS